MRQCSSIPCRLIVLRQSDTAGDCFRTEPLIPRCRSKAGSFTVDINDNVVTVKGKLGELSQEFSEVTIKIEEGNVIVERPSDLKAHKAKHGLYRSLIGNMIEGVSAGWTKHLELIGVGFRASCQGQKQIGRASCRERV